MRAHIAVVLGAVLVAHSTAAFGIAESCQRGLLQPVAVGAMPHACP